MYLYLLSGCFVCLFVFAASFLSFLLYFLELLWWLSYKESTCHAGDSGETVSIPGSGRSHWRGNGTPGFLPRESHGQRNLEGYIPWGCKRDKHDWVNEHLSLLLCGKTSSVMRTFQQLYVLRKKVFLPITPEDLGPSAHNQARESCWKWTLWHGPTTDDHSPCQHPNWNLVIDPQNHPAKLLWNFWHRETVIINF